MRRILLAAIAAIAFAACSTNPSPATAPQQKPLLGDHGFDMTAMDRTAVPCDDFYSFAVGKWRESHPLPAMYSRYGRFEELAERNRDVLHKILEEDASAAKSAPAGSAAAKLGDFYNACMSETLIESAGVTSIQPDLDRINAIADRRKLEDEMARLQQKGIAPAFRFGAEADYKNSKLMIAGISQAGLGLPDRDYYLSPTERFSKIRAQYLEHITKMFALTGESSERAAEDAQRVLDLETKLAKAQMSRVEMRDPNKRYHPTEVAKLAADDPNIEWTRYFGALGVNDLQSVNVAQPEYFQALNQMIADVPLDVWKAYLRWHVINSAAPTLSSSIVNEDFDFNNRILSGQQQMMPRWQRCVRAADTSMGMLLGQEYVKRTFTPEAKAKANQLIDNLIAALRADIPTLSWMGPETKQAALGKLSAFQRRIGYPDQWVDYSALNVAPDSYYANAIAARQFAFRRNVGRIGKSPDPNDWGFFTPSTVNASYQASQNHITFPAGILQPPFYDPNADDAYNYGGIGTVIGHEMTHGFDDQGAKFDADGNLRNWWTAQDLTNFEARAECISNLYSEFNVAPGININGKLVTGEEIADLGGATIALAAYERSLQGKPREAIDGFSPEQRFFLGFAQVWGENMAPEEATKRALTDPHAQGPFRVNGTVQNMPAFQKAFGCANGSKMVREEGKRCSIW